ncbi:alpha/beta fold hydrolase [Kocuria coralli]|uniref:Alpha/beta fold hydrolase n=1 Tax=Kocuria coralli TaxID=1461025 RepID=A0A5J5KXD6_9MICC|nr:alpha/beta fold hydrolase [Kocuria coralli]KAA9394437.1 alpha/beta fold hydrolase [Kocuria coralli]
MTDAVHDPTTSSADASGGVALPTEAEPRLAFRIPRQSAAPAGPGRSDDASVGVLVLHGFTGAVYGVRDWALSLSPRYSISAPALPGHRTTWQDLGRTTWRDWYDHAADELAELQAEHDRVVVAGLSMGGALALRLAQDFGRETEGPGAARATGSAGRRPVDGVVVVNPALSLHRRDARAAKLVSRFLTSTAGIGNDVARPGMSEHAYPRTPVAGVVQLNELMAVTTRDLGRIQAPVLVLRSRQDHIVSDASHQRIMRRCSGPVETVVLPRSYHMTTLDHEAGVVNARTGRFVDAVAAGLCPITGLPLADPAASPGTGGDLT